MWHISSLQMKIQTMLFYSLWHPCSAVCDRLPRHVYYVVWGGSWRFILYHKPFCSFSATCSCAVSSSFMWDLFLWKATSIPPMPYFLPAFSNAYSILLMHELHLLMASAKAEALSIGDGVAWRGNRTWHWWAWLVWWLPALPKPQRRRWPFPPQGYCQRAGTNYPSAAVWPGGVPSSAFVVCVCVSHFG